MIRWLIVLTLAVLPMFANIGQFTKVEGDVTIMRGSETLPAAVGTEILESDAVKTAGKSRAELRFTDNTIINIGQNSDFLVEDYFFDQSENSRTTLKVTKGAFAAITGMIGKVAPKKFALKTRTSTIGIRGTDFLGKITSLGDTIACKGGTIAVGSIELDVEPVIVEAGMVTTVKPGESPTPPRPYTPKEIKKLEGGAGKGDAPSDEEEGEPGPESDPIPTEEPEDESEPIPVLGPDPIPIASPELPVPEPEIPEINYEDYYLGYWAYHTATGVDVGNDPRSVLMTPKITTDGSTATITFFDDDLNEFFSVETEITSIYTGSSSSLPPGQSSEIIVGGGDEYDYLAWGSWDSATYNPASADPNTKQFFIAGDVTFYNELPNDIDARYSGFMTGQTCSGAEIVGSVSFDVNFVDRVLSGSFSESNALWASGTFGQTDIDAVDNYSFFSGDMSGSSEYGDLSGGYNGSFFGPSAVEMGGNWYLQNSTVKATGVFAAKKQLR